jgi:phosphate uptake regulator
MYVFTVVHPPITIENLLSMAAHFELSDEDKTILWKAEIRPGCVIPIHTVSLEKTLFLTIRLAYCEPVEGVCVHQPRNVANREKSLTKKLKRFLDEMDTEEVSTIVLQDSIAQKLRLHSTSLSILFRVESL